MKLISLEDYSKITEAVIGLSRLATKEDLSQLSEKEFNNLIKFLLLQSGSGFVVENKTALKSLMLEHNLADESQFTEKLNESLNEDWDDDISGALVATGAGVVAGAASLASYINFLFKKKKIKKAWEEVRDLKKEKSDLDVEEYTTQKEMKDQLEKDLEAQEPELDKEQLKDELDKVDKRTAKAEEQKTKKEEELENYDAQKEPKLADAKQKVNDIRQELNQLDPRSYKDPAEDPEPEPEKKEESGDDSGDDDKKAKAKEAKDKMDKEASDAKAKIDKDVEDNKKKMKGESLQEADDESGDEGPEGELQIKQKAVKDAQPDPEEVPDLKQKAGEPFQKEINKGVKANASETDKKKKEKWAKEKKAIVSKKKKAQDAVENPPEYKAAKEDLKKTKDKIKNEQNKLAAARSEVQKYADDDGKTKIQDEINAIDVEIESADADKKELRAKAKADKDMAENKAKLKDEYKENVEREKERIKQAKEDVDKQIEDATQNADNISGTSGGGAEASTLSNKTLGFSKKYANQVKAEHDADIAKHVKGNRSKMGMDTKDIDSRLQQAKSRISNAEKEMKDKENSVDAPEKDIKQAKTKVKMRTDAQDAEKEKEKSLEIKDSMNFREKYRLAIMEAQRKELIPEEDEEKKSEDKKDVSDKPKPFVKKEKPDTDTDGEGDVEGDYEKQLKKDSAKENKDNPLIGKKVVLRNMLDKDQGHLEGALGKVVHSFKENEREPEGDMPRRSGEPEVYKIKLDNPKDPMYPDINLTKDFFEEHKEKKKEDKAEESIANKFRNALNEAKKR